MKRCITCEIYKDFLHFGKKSSSKDGYRNQCKSCRKIYRIKNKHKIDEYRKYYNKKNKEKIRKREYVYRKSNIEKIKLRRKLYTENNKVKIQTTQRNYKIKNKEKIKEYNKLYKQINKDKINTQKRLYQQNRRKNDINYKLKDILRNRINKLIKRRQRSTIEYLGCTIEEFIQYIESKFDKNMNWNNYGVYGWHIDHIRPLSSFDLSDNEELKQAMHYTNLQPLWAIDNILKSNRY